MPIQFKTYSLPKDLTKDVMVSIEDTNRISIQLRKAHQKMAKRIKTINRKQNIWQRPKMRLYI